MKNDTLQLDSLSEAPSTTAIHSDTFVSKDTPSTVSTIDTLASKDANQCISIIETEHATNNKLTSIVSVLSIMMACSIIFNIILLIILKKNKNNLKIKKMEQQVENGTQINKADISGNGLPPVFRNGTPNF